MEGNDAFKNGNNDRASEKYLAVKFHKEYKLIF